MAMALYPNIQRRAQEEISKITENGRLPSLADRDSMPYVSQILLETLRWHAVIPTG